MHKSSSYKVLIVDDNFELRLDLSDILKLEGYDVFTAANGREALTLLKDRKIDVIISDYEMPTMNGYVFLDTLRSQKETSHLPFILITGSMEPLPESTLNFRFMRKPISVEKLISLVAEVISHPNGEDQRAAD